MSIKKTLGGERLGNGKKIRVDMHGWGRSTFNQDRIWRSTMTSGVLTPCFEEWGLNGTTFHISTNLLAHTIPAISPLFGSFKVQVDFFACPVRLYQGLLHNNAVNIGLEMSKVLQPNITLNPTNNTKRERTNTSSLNNYLGIKGYTPEQKTFNAVSHLAYYDIFKQYYSNKQEPMAKVISYIKENNPSVDITNVYIMQYSQYGEETPTTKATANKTEQNSWDISNIQGNIIELRENSNINVHINKDEEITIDSIKLFFENENFLPLEANFNQNNGNTWQETTLYNAETAEKWGWCQRKDNIINVYIEKPQGYTAEIGTFLKIDLITNKYGLTIRDFELENIDEARRKILAKSNLLQRVNLNTDLNFLPYSTNFETENIPNVKKNLNGLVLKTYQNDIFNCWLSTEFIEMINEISAITPNEDGNITMDALILAKKVYNVLNRIAISGGTYEDWQESVFGENAIRRAESPIYIGGMSSEITFEEVVSTASATNADGENQPLASLGGKGVTTKPKGGNIVYKCDEPCVILGIISITPRVDYHQGNKWYRTELDTMDNFHKPGFDGIGFQNLIANNVVWSDSPEKALAKQTAWLNYQTAYNEVYGYFALNDDEENTLHHMVLRRNFETDENGEITDFTSYIDPSKYNYAFADNSLAAQNFWVQLGFNVKSRRKMASTEIPNL